MHEHPHEFTQFTLTDKDDLKVDPNFTNVLKNSRDQLGSLNANMKNFSEATKSQNNTIVFLTLVIATAALVEAIIRIAEIVK